LKYFNVVCAYLDTVHCDGAYL